MTSPVVYAAAALLLAHPGPHQDPAVAAALPAVACPDEHPHPLIHIHLVPAHHHHHWAPPPRHHHHHR